MALAESAERRDRSITMGTGMRHTVEGGVRELFPGYFAFVMACGIVSAALNAFGYALPARVAFLLAAVGYGVLWLLTGWRIARFPKLMWTDLCSFMKGPAYFTTIAATTVLGAVSLRLFEGRATAFVLLCIGFVLCGVLTYTFATIAIVTSDKPLGTSVSPSWLVIVVGTQSLSVLCSLLTRPQASDSALLFIGAAMFMIGSAAYMLIASLLLSRLLLAKVEPEDLNPLHWIMMGAAAISCLAGTELNSHAEAWEFQVRALPVLQGFTLFFWVVATAWMPLLLILTVWKHGIRKAPMRYEPQLWSVVFPLGMYSFATHSMADEFQLEFLHPIAAVFLGLASTVWVIVLVGLVRHLVRGAARF